MFKLSTVIILPSYISICSAQDMTLTLRPGELKTKFLFSRFNVTEPGPEDYE